MGLEQLADQIAENLAAAGESFGEKFTSNINRVVPQIEKMMTEIPAPNRHFEAMNAMLDKMLSLLKRLVRKYNR